MTVSHQVTEGSVVAALVGSAGEGKLGLSQIEKLLYLLSVLREVMERFLCDDSQTDKQLYNVVSFIFKHFVKLQGTLVLVIGTVGGLFTFLRAEHDTTAVLVKSEGIYRNIFITKLTSHGSGALVALKQWRQ